MPPQKMPTYHEVAQRMRGVAIERGEWAGIPIPVDGQPLTLEPKYPYQFPKKEYDNEGYEPVNQWWSDRLRCMIIVAKKDGKYVAYPSPYNTADMLVGTLGASSAWLPSAEAKALVKLGELVKPHTLAHYTMTGTFLETSKRSRVTYMFRKLRPTIAMVANQRGTMRTLCGLCLHPIGYYSGTWAGAMCPTDDVIAHLCMMRGDEPKFWANANQHPPHHPASGL